MSFVRVPICTESGVLFRRAVHLVELWPLCHVQLPLIRFCWLVDQPKNTFVPPVIGCGANWLFEAKGLKEPGDFPIGTLVAILLASA